jgi:hypothetical protein
MADDKKAVMPALVVGCGVIARYHLKAMEECGRFAVAAVADASEDSRNKFADEVAAVRGGQRPATFASLADAVAADPDKAMFGVVFILVRLHACYFFLHAKLESSA